MQQRACALISLRTVPQPQPMQGSSTSRPVTSRYMHKTQPLVVSSVIDSGAGCSSLVEVISCSELYRHCLSSPWVLFLPLVSDALSGRTPRVAADSVVRTLHCLSCAICSDRGYSETAEIMQQAGPWPRCNEEHPRDLLEGLAGCYAS